MTSDFIKNKNYKTYYRIYGNLRNKWEIPLIMIHGGPGQTSDYWKTIAAVQSKYLGPVIIYDQIGCGKSVSKIPVKKLTINMHTNQLIQLIKELKLEKVHLMGHSWGSVVALEAYLKIPDNIMSIVFYSPCISVKLWRKTADKYVDNIKKICGNNKCNIESLYTNKHIGNPRELVRFIKGSNNKIYNYFWGKTEYEVTGIMKNYEKVGELKKIDIPVHYIGGKFDTASPDVLKYLAQKTPNATFKVHNKSRHIAHIDEKLPFIKNIVLFYNSFYELALHFRFNTFITEMLKSKTIQHTSIIFTTVFILKNRATQVYKKRNLDAVLKQLIKRIPKANSTPTKKLFDLQEKLDYWYFTKLLGFKNKFKPKQSIIDKFFNEKNIISCDDPRDAVLYYVYIRTLTICDPKKYGNLDKYVSNLKRLSKRDAKCYIYFLTHVILYDLNFGIINTIPKSSKNALVEIYQFCENNLDYIHKDVDLMGEIILCCKLCHTYNFPYYGKLVSRMIPTKVFEQFHENAVLAVVSCKWDNHKIIKQRLS